MVAAIKIPDDGVILKFGGGIHSIGSEDEINPKECRSGQNFELDPSNSSFRNRPAFDLEGTAPNGAEIRGFAQLVKTDGATSMLVQAGNTVYEWNGSTFISVATVDSNARLRGRLEHNWELDDKVLITDLNLVEPVSEWDGTTFKAVPHNLTGLFLSKYCRVDNERAFFGNVISNSVATPQILVGSEREDYTVLSISDRPSSSRNEADPFYLPMPDLKVINGLVGAFRKVIVSTEKGNIWTLEGESAKDFSFEQLYPFSGATGDESLAYIGNDIVYGRQGRIESVFATQRYGDVQTDDITFRIQNLIKTFKSWTTVYNSRVQHVYLFPADQSEVWTYHKNMVGSEISPWSRETTQHSSGFQPTAVMNMFDPVDDLEYVFFGDGDGNLYKMEGSTVSGDAGSVNIVSERLSIMYAMPFDAEAYDIEGYVQYRRKDLARPIVMTLEYSGEKVFNEAITITIPAISTRPVYGTSGPEYYGGGSYYGAAFAGRLTRQKFTAAGRSNNFQVRLRTEGSEDFEIDQIGIRFSAAS